MEVVETKEQQLRLSTEEVAALLRCSGGVA
jgi:ATP/maltotriose-dependent transcriptional regulator MalT